MIAGDLVFLYFGNFVYYDMIIYIIFNVRVFDIWYVRLYTDAEDGGDLDVL